MPGFSQSAIFCAALAGVVAMGSPLRAEDSMPVSGTEILTNVEMHMIPSRADAARQFGAARWMGAISSPGWFDSMQSTATEMVLSDLQRGQGQNQGDMVWINNDGRLVGSYVVKTAFTVDEKTKTPKGTFEGTWQISEGSGRFAGVSGHGIVKGTFDGVEASDQWSGTISGFRK
ncbi:MAG: hypothetical protein JOZ17_19365 [Acetobacteraceae bacterium]|nr:hypothetical protein [Acetobacteraceae bacterium]